MRLRYLRPDVPRVELAHEHDSCFDLRSAEEDFILLPGERRVVSTGIALDDLEPGFEIQIRPRSGLAAKHGVTVLNAPGTVDAGYRGEILVVLYNASDEPFRVRKGDRIAQAAICPVVTKDFVPAAGGMRGDGGLGSTGVA